MTVDVGGPNDAVELRLAGKVVKICESYSVELSFFKQPSAFHIELGDDSTAGALVKQFPPNTPFELRVMGRTIASGRLDAPGFSYYPTKVSLTGRDHMAVVHDTDVQADKTLKGLTFQQLVEHALDECFGAGRYNLVFDNNANRVAITNAKNAKGKPRQVQLEVVESVGGGKIFRTPQARVGESWLAFVNRHLERVGLFLWCMAALDEAQRPTFVLSEPVKNQPPIYKIVHKRGRSGVAGAANPTGGATFKNDTTNRHSRVDVYARGGGGKFRRSSVLGSHTDQEMVGWGFKKIRSVRDAECSTKAEAEYMARAAVARERRDGWLLEYQLAGHTVPLLGGGVGVWAFDTIVTVDDEDLAPIGVAGPHWIETVTLTRSEKRTTTKVKLMRPDDLIYGDLG